METEQQHQIDADRAKIEGDVAKMREQEKAKFATELKQKTDDIAKEKHQAVVQAESKVSEIIKIPKIVQTCTTYNQLILILKTSYI